MKTVNANVLCVNVAICVDPASVVTVMGLASCGRQWKCCMTNLWCASHYLSPKQLCPCVHNGISSVPIAKAGQILWNRELNGIFLFTPNRVWCEQLTGNLFPFIVLFVASILIS